MAGFRTKLGFKLHDITMNKEESVTSKIMKAFPNEKILLLHSVLSYPIDLYFTEHKLAIEIDEKGHTNRNVGYEIQRQKAIEKELGCKFIRINPDAKNYDIFIEIGKIHNHIIESTKDNIAERLLELEFKSMKSKCLKFIVKKILPSLVKHANVLFKL